MNMNDESEQQKRYVRIIIRNVMDKCDENEGIRIMKMQKVIK